MTRFHPVDPHARGVGQATRIPILAWELLALLAILSLAAYLRFANLHTNPGWYSDEGTVADIARHLAQGRIQYLALTRSTLLAARQPLVPLLASLAVRLGGEALPTLRAMAAAFGVATAGLLYLLVRRALGVAGAGLGLLSALLFAIYPPAVFYNRMGFGYNLLTPLVVVAAGGLWIYLNEGRKGALAVSALAVGIGSVADLMMVSLAAPLALVVAVRRGRDLAWSLPLLAAPWTVYAVMMMALDPAAFTFDLGFIASRLTAVPAWAQLPLVVFNLGTLMLDDPWWLLAILGLLLLRPRPLQLLALVTLLLPLLLLGRSAGLAGVRRYSISPLYPLLALGAASLIWHGLPWVIRQTQAAFRDQLRRFSFFGSARGAWIGDRLTALGTAGFVFLLVLTPLLISTLRLVQHVGFGFRPDEEWAYLDPRAARAAAGHLERVAGEGDFILASPALAWMLDGPAADFQQSAAYQGLATIDYPADVPHDRFAFDASHREASYAVVDAVWREWGAVHMSGVGEMLREIEAWPRVWSQGGIEIYKNPGR